MQKLAITRGKRKLASGLYTDFYIDARPVYLGGQGLFLIGELFYDMMLGLEKQAEHFGACGGMAMGAIPLSCALSQAAYRNKRELPSLFVRKEAKSHGLEAKVEGVQGVPKKSRLLLLEDVVTTASSAIKAQEALTNEGFEVKHLLAIVDREQGGKEALKEVGVSLNSLFTLKELRG